MVPPTRRGPEENFSGASSQFLWNRLSAIEEQRATSIIGVVLDSFWLTCCLQCEQPIERSQVLSLLANKHILSQFAGLEKNAVSFQVLTH